MTQHEIIIEYIKENRYIVPAKLNDKQRAFREYWIGSQADKRCREMRNKIEGRWKNPYGKKMLDSIPFGRFTLYYLTGTNPPVAQEFTPQPTNKLLPMTDKVREWNRQFEKPREEVKQNSLF